jgi:Amt family ammonium transporter
MKALIIPLCASVFVTGAKSSDAETDELLKRVAYMERHFEQEIEHLREENHQLKEKYEKDTHSRQLAAGRSLGDGVPSNAIDHMWLILCGALVMLMQAGFAMVEAGACRVKNVQNILMKNVVDVCFGTISWWALGWMFAYGFDADQPKEVFIGFRQYFGHEFGESDAEGNQKPTAMYRDWFFQWTFCSAAATIVSGGVAERVQFPGYLVYTIAMTSFIYPVVVAWMWSTNGWLTQPGKDVEHHLNQVGFTDFAGSGIVHLTGGMGALIGAICVGPRKGRFDGDGDESFAPHSLPLIVLGTFILWFGWYGFNCGSTLGMSSDDVAHQGAIVAMNTTLSASAGGIMVMLLRLIILRKYDIGGMCNGILVGLVSITAGCGNMDCGWAAVSGLIGGIVYQGASSLLQMLKVDDPIDAFAVHGAGGMWGVLAAAIFDWGAGFNQFNGFAGGLGNIADWDGNTKHLWKSGFAAAVVECLVIVAWVGTLSLLIFLPLRVLGLLRCADEVQDVGMDASKHSPSQAYQGQLVAEAGVI